jgi:LPXTG-motif cell wall-anchored protein
VFGDSRSGGKRSAQRPRSTSKPAAAVHHGRVAHSSGDPGVTIADFHFAPGTTTVHAGDTITWTNNGPSPHTATANNGSFNTGTLHPGQSASHVFTQAGTFTYFCSIHPFMHGTIVVLAATSSPSSNSSPSSSSPSSSSGSTPTTQPSTTAAIPTTTSASTAQSLPDTGMNVGAALLAGMVILGLGLVLRRTVARPGR